MSNRDELKLMWQTPVTYDETYGRLKDAEGMLIVDYNVYGEDKINDILGSQLAFVLNRYARLSQRESEIAAVLEAVEAEPCDLSRDRGCTCYLKAIAAIREQLTKEAK